MNNNIDIYGPKPVALINQLIEAAGADPASLEGQLVTQIFQTGLRLLAEGHDTGQLKVITRAMKEMRYAYDIFNRFKDKPCISIFGSARTPETHPDYLAALNFSRAMAARGWMCMTGAANGIMKAGLEGPKIESTFGLSIRLPFEVASNTVIEGDPKLMIFRYFFTRKLMFMSHSNAMAAFPGGVGTMDELFEVLTLIQTGKSNIIPIVLLEGADGTYWQAWRQYLSTNLLNNGWISPEDTRFFHHAATNEEAVEHILKFYSRYHSSRYVKDLLVIRLLSPLSQKQIDTLNLKYNRLIASGAIAASESLPEETEHQELSRIVFHHTRKDFGLLRIMIDEINDF
ncbi:MAG: LOG family protein [Parachlamydiaceae bacterium]|nr:LOG family protein [Parachlamydiaceae bacterium]